MGAQVRFVSEGFSVTATLNDSKRDLIARAEEQGQKMEALANLENRTEGAVAGLSRQLSDRARISLNGTYTKQTTSTGGSTPGVRQSTAFDAYRADISFTYKFDPWIY